MKLKERIEMATDTEILHIGSKSSFFFIGTKAEYYRDIFSITKNMMKTANNAVNSCKTKLCYLLSIHAPKASIKENTDKLKYWQHYIDTFVPPDEREITEEYPRLLRDGIVISVEGTENGKYWLRSEYLANYRPTTALE